jgi:hypothetical protein
VSTRRITVECFEVENASKEGPAHGHVCDEYGGAGFANVPEFPVWAEGVCEGVVFVEHGAHYLPGSARLKTGRKGKGRLGRAIVAEERTYDEDPEAEQDAEDEFPCARKLRGDEERKRDAEHHYIGRDVEDRVRDQMVYRRRALFCPS